MPGAVLGQGLGSARPQGSLRLPCVTELFTELLDASVPDDNQPSCSVRVSLASRGLFVNEVAVRFAAQLLYELFSKERLDQHRSMPVPSRAIRRPGRTLVTSSGRMNGKRRRNRGVCASGPRHAENGVWRDGRR